MKILFWIFVVLTGLSGLAAMQFKDTIKSTALRAVMIGLAAAGLLGVAVMELSRITVHYTRWAELATINALVPAGWLLTSLFVFAYAAGVYIIGRRSRINPKG